MKKRILVLVLASTFLAGCASQPVKKTSVPTIAATQSPKSPAPAEATPLIVAKAESLGKPLQGTRVRIEEAMFCTGVKDRVPVGVAASFPASVGKVFFFTRVLGAKKPTTVTHVWYWNEKKMAEIPLEVRSENWRTWSSKLIQTNGTGSWAVKVLDESGDVVITRDFQIQ
jgi:hypothetical protein